MMTEFLTEPQKRALRVLADGELHETAASSSRSPITANTARFLVRRKWATRHFTVNGREIAAAQRADYGPYEWRTAIRITDAGRGVLKTATGGER